MLVKVDSSAIHGVDAYIVEVEVDVATGFPSFNYDARVRMTWRADADRRS